MEGKGEESGTPGLFPRPDHWQPTLPLTPHSPFPPRFFSSTAPCLLPSTPFLRPEARGASCCSGREPVSVGFQSLQLKAFEIRPGNKPHLCHLLCGWALGMWLTSEPLFYHLYRRKWQYLPCTLLWGLRKMPCKAHRSYKAKVIHSPPRKTHTWCLHCLLRGFITVKL